MPNEITNKKVISSLFYKFMERIGAQSISFVVQIILARLLLPSDYGMLAMLVVFINISQVFIQSGMNTALIQRKDVSDADYSSVFYISLIISIVLYGALFFSAPYIALFYSMPELASVLRVLALILIPGAFNSIQIAKASREMQFKKLMYSTFIATIITGTIGITMAYRGFGVWALVTQQLSAQIISCLLLMLLIKWKIRITLDMKRVKVFFSFGWKLMCSSLLNTLYLNIQTLVVGRRYSADVLGYYNRGDQYPQFIITNINASILSVMFPALSSQQDNKDRLAAMVRRAVVTSSFLIFPLMMGLAVIAEPLVLILLTEKWLPAVPYLRIFCFIYAFYPIHTTNLQALNAQGRSDLFLKLEVIKVSISAAVLFFCIYLFDSPVAIALGSAVMTVIGCYINTYPNKKLLGYGYIRQMSDILPSLVLSLVMGACVYALLWLQLSSLVTLILQIFTGIVIYIALAWLLKLECFMYLKNIIAENLAAKRKGKSVS